MLEPNHHTDLLLERSRILWRERHIPLILKMEAGVLRNAGSSSNQLKNSKLDLYLRYTQNGQDMH